MHSRRFTFIELLVVVTLLAVLSALMLPLLYQAKQHATDVTCMSNKRQLLQALLTYGSEHDNDLPPTQTGWWTSLDHVHRDGFDPLLAYGVTVQHLDSAAIPPDCNPAGYLSRCDGYQADYPMLWTGASVLWWGGLQDVPWDWGCAVSRGWGSTWPESNDGRRLESSNRNRIVLASDRVFIFADNRITRLTHPKLGPGWSDWGDRFVRSETQFLALVRGSHEAFTDGHVAFTRTEDLAKVSGFNRWFNYFRTPGR